MRKIVILMVAFIVFSVGFLSGCTSNNNSNDNNNITEDEDTIQVSVLSTERMHRLRTDDGFTFPDAGNDFFTVEIKVTNIGDNEEYTSSSYATIADTTGMTYKDSIYTNALSDEFDNLDIQPNNYNQGKILFEIPIDCTVAYFYYNDLHNDITLQISEPGLDIPTEEMTAEEIYNEFNSTVDEIDKIWFNISLELVKPIQGYDPDYTLVSNLGGDIVYLCVDYAQDILPLLPIPTEYEEARTEFNLSLYHWGQMGLYYIYYGNNQDMDDYIETITQKNIADEHWVNCTGVLGFL